MRLSGLIPEPGSPLDRVATLVISNIAWVFLSLMIIPLPAATAGLFAVMTPLARNKDREFFATFFSTMRRQWRKATLLGLLDFALGALVLVNLQALATMPLPEAVVWFLRSLTLIVGLVLLLANLYAWPLLVMFDLPMGRLIKVSLLLTLAHPLQSLLTLVLGAAPIVAGLFLPLWLLFVGFVSLSALAISWGSWRVIRQRASAEELEELDDPMRAP
ncbi:MAG: DUF624 domain-containing protein [Anaerolineaceae bacterium]|nr:DUF624 domain-containing protein [Anaerolineaceae bacterium]